MADLTEPRAYIDPRKSPSAESDAPDALLLGRRIRHFRTAKNLTLAQLAQATDTTAAQLSHIENGRREPRLSLLQAIARELGTPAGELLAVEPPPDRRGRLELALTLDRKSVV